MPMLRYFSVIIGNYWYFLWGLEIGSIFALSISIIIIFTNSIHRMNLILIAEEGERKLIEKYLPDCRWEVLVTGVGAVNVIRALRDLPRDTHILNIGYAGSADFEIGTLVEVSEVRLNHPNCKYDEPVQALAPCEAESAEPAECGGVPSLFPIADRRAVCYTNSDFVLQSDYRDCVFDMELAYIAAMGFERVSALKVVSDNLSLHTYHQTTNGVQ